MRTELLNSLPTELHIIGIHEIGEVGINDEYLDARYSQKICNHSPTGFNWGYGGSGPAQLALAILMKYLPVEEAYEYYQDFKFLFVANLPQTDFNVTIDLKKIIQQICLLKSKQ